jgi:selenocysteine-specific elongation factor
VRIEALEGEGGLQDLMTIRFHHLASEVLGRLRFGGSAELEAGESAFAQIRLSRPVAALPGDRFILRRPSPAATLGGGVILDNMPGKLRTAESAAWKERLARLEDPDSTVRLHELVRGGGKNGMDLPALRARTGIQLGALREALARQVASKALIEIPGDSPRYLDRVIYEAALTEMVDSVKSFHRNHPLQVGLSKEEIRSRLFRREAGEVFRACLEEAVRRGLLRLDRDLVALAGHQVQLQGAEAGALERIEGAYREGGLNPPEMEEVMAKLSLDRPKMENIFFLLLKQGRLIRIKEGKVYHAEALESLKRKVWDYRATSDLLDIATFKDLSGTTRKNAIPLLEHLDATRVTRRDGNNRRILPPPSH